VTNENKAKEMPPAVENRSQNYYAAPVLPVGQRGGYDRLPVINIIKKRRFVMKKFCIFDLELLNNRRIAVTTVTIPVTTISFLM
jgi:hypothetical protein